MSLRDHFIQLARNNAWSNGRLYGVCRQLDAAALTAVRVSFFPTILSTLEHIWLVDEYYVDGLTGGGRGYAIFESEGTTTAIEPLWKHQRALDDRLIAFCEAQSGDGDLATEVTLQRRAGPVVDTRADILAHVFVHQIHHRGQVHAMLSGTALAPPPLDEWFLHSDRGTAERELAALEKT